MEPRRIDLDALLTARAFMRVERPPELWRVDVDDEPFIRMLGEMIVVGLLHHDALGELTLDASTEPLWSADLDAVVRASSVSFGHLRSSGQEEDPSSCSSLDRSRRRVLTEGCRGRERLVPTRGERTRGASTPRRRT